MLGGTGTAPGGGQEDERRYGVVTISGVYGLCLPSTVSFPFFRFEWDDALGPTGAYRYPGCACECFSLSF